MTKISICIPMYEFNNKGKDVLEFSFKILEKQTFKDFDIVVSDDSSDNIVENLCKEWSNKLDIKYYKNKTGKGAASNTNNAVKHAGGEYIKFLNGDDYLLDERSLEKIANALDENCYWLASAYWHTKDRINLFRLHIPKINPVICVVNTIGTPSGVTIKNVENIPLFDTKLKYAYDCSFYHEFWKLHGDPKILNEATMVCYIWGQSVSSKITPEFIQQEETYILKKYGFIL